MQNMPKIQSPPFLRKTKRIWPGLIALLVCLMPFTLQAKRTKVKKCKSDKDCGFGQKCVAGICRAGTKVGSYRKSEYLMAIVPPIWQGKTLGHAQNSIIRKLNHQFNNNFGRMVGSFKVIPRRSYLEKPPFNGVELGTFFFKPWQKINANGLLKISVKAVDKKKIKVGFRFYDVNRSLLLIREDKTIEAKDSVLRWNVHLFSNRLYKRLTGHRGHFTSLIAYVRRNRKKGKDIWVMDFDGSNHRCVVSNGFVNILPSWSPDGKSIYYTSFVHGAPYLYKLNLTTRKIYRVSRVRGTYTGARLSPNSKRLAFSMSPYKGRTDADIYVSNPDGTKMKRLTKAWGIDATPSWSPDGKKIAFVSDRYTTPQIFMMNVDGSDQKRLTFRGNYNQEPRWSPNGKEILFTGRDERFQYDLFVIRFLAQVDGTTKLHYRRLTQDEGKNFEATWSPDGRYILFVSTRTGERKLFIMDPEGKYHVQFLKKRGDFESPAWSISHKTPPLPTGTKGYYFYRTTKLMSGPIVKMIKDSTAKAKVLKKGLPTIKKPKMAKLVPVKKRVAPLKKVITPKVVLRAKPPVARKEKAKKPAKPVKKDAKKTAAKDKAAKKPKGKEKKPTPKK